MNSNIWRVASHIASSGSALRCDLYQGDARDIVAGGHGRFPVRDDLGLYAHLDVDIVGPHHRTCAVCTTAARSCVAGGQRNVTRPRGAVPTRKVAHHTHVTEQQPQTAILMSTITWRQAALNGLSVGRQSRLAPSTNRAAGTTLIARNSMPERADVAIRERRQPFDPLQ